MSPLRMVTFWTFQLRQWRDAFWAHRWLFIYSRSRLRDNPLSHRRPTRRAGLLIPSRFTQLLTVNSRTNVCFHEVTPLAWRISHYSGVLCLAVAISWGLNLKRRPFSR